MIGVVDRWKPEGFRFYRPVVHLTADASPKILRQLELCLQSPHEFAAYGGPVVVMTDRPRAGIPALWPFPARQRIRIDAMRPADAVGYAASKPGIFDEPHHRGHQPLLYLDPDVPFDRPLRPMPV